MCTVSYIPIADSGQFILTSNRDEAPGRDAYDLVVEKRAKKEICFPQDPNSGGSWIAISNTQQVACLLNGAHVKHKHNPPYRRSRGLVLLDAFEYETFPQFAEEYSFQNIEPFTLIFLENGSIFELMWDGSETFINEMDPERFHLWASSTLYTKEQRERRLEWFNAWIATKPELSIDSIINFHSIAGDGDIKNDLVMNREEKVKTLSISSILFARNDIQLIHKNLQNSQTQQYSFQVVPHPKHS